MQNVFKDNYKYRYVIVEYPIILILLILNWSFSYKRFTFSVSGDQSASYIHELYMLWLLDILVSVN